MRIKYYLGSLALLLIATCTQVSAKTLSLNPQQIKNLGIQLIKPVAVKKSPILRAPATLSIPPSLDFIVSTAHEGMIDRVAVSVGDSVAKGQLLARVFSPGYLGLQREYLSVLSDQEMASTRFHHDETLFKEGVISKHRLMETRAKYNKYNVLFNEYRQLLKVGGMSSAEVKRLTRKKVLQNYLNLKAPVEGVVLKKMVIAGQQVGPMAPIFRIASLKKLYVELAVPQERLIEISLNDEIEIEQAAVSGKIILIGKNVDLESQSVLVRAVIDDTSGMLRPGQNISVQLFRRSDKNLYQVPTGSIFRSERISYLFVRTATGFEAKIINVVGQNASGVVVEDSLNAKDEVVSIGVAPLKSLWLEQSEEE